MACFEWEKNTCYVLREDDWMFLLFVTTSTTASSRDGTLKYVFITSYTVNPIATDGTT